MELSGIFFQTIFNVKLIDYVNAKPVDTEGQLYFLNEIMFVGSIEPENKQNCIYVKDEASE